MPVLTNAKHEAVALAYLADPQKIGWRAYRKIYPKSAQHASETQFSRLLRNVEFATRLKELGEKVAEGVVLSARQVLEELTKLGISNMQDYVSLDADGQPVLAFSALNRDQWAAIRELVIEERTNPGTDTRPPETTRTTKFKLADKRASLVDLGRHHKLFTDRVEHTFSGVAERLAAALLRTDGKTHAEVRPHRHPPRKRGARKAARKGKRARA